MITHFIAYITLLHITLLHITLYIYNIVDISLYHIVKA
jgi:hypothetical protein